jgi:hypothetical protein
MCYPNLSYLGFKPIFLATRPRPIDNKKLSKNVTPVSRYANPLFCVSPIRLYKKEEMCPMMTPTMEDIPPPTMGPRRQPMPNGFFPIFVIGFLEESDGE